MTNSSLLELYNLEGEFDNTLLQYKKEYANYINLLNNSNHYSRSEIKTAIQTLHSINEKLISINKKITTQLGSIKQVTDEPNKMENLTSIYRDLLFEKEKIRKMQAGSETINMENASQSKNVDHQYAQYLFWTIVAVVISFLTCRLLFFPAIPLNSKKFYFWVIVSSLFFVSALYSYMPTGFLILCMIIVYIALGFMKVLPMP